MKNQTSHFIYIKKAAVYFGIFFIWGCANIISPTGGDRDYAAPKILSTTPADLSTNFVRKEIKILFNEYFALNNPAAEIYLSPDAREPLKWRIRKKKLTLLLPDSLNKNTTYIIHFGNAIADITEGTKLEGFNYVFSTGAVIDSFRIQGAIVDAKTQAPQKGFLVMLYDSYNDSAVAKSKPSYFARTNDRGNFVLSHLKKGSYRLFALNDQNSNYLFDQPSEEVAFIDSMILVSDTSAVYNLNSFLSTNERAELNSVSTNNNKKVTLRFSKPVKNILIETISDSTEILFESHNVLADTFYLWINTKQTDSVFFKLNLGNEIDSFGLKLRSTPVSQSKVVSVKFPIKSNLQGIKNKHELFPKQKLELYFSNPLNNIAKDILATITNDSTGEIKKTLFIKKIDSVTQMPYSFCNYNFQPGIKYSVVIPAGLFEDVYGNKNDSTVFQFSQLSENTSGNLTISITSNDSLNHYIAQLLTSNTISKEWKLTYGKNIFELKALIPGAYKLQFIRDENENGKWDSGDYWKNKQPEKINLYNKEITVRSNWDLEIEAEVGASLLGKLKK